MSRRVWDYLQRYRAILVAALHVGFSAAAFYLAFAFRLDRFDPWTETYGRFFFAALPILLAIRFAAFLKFDLFRGMWRYVSIPDLMNILVAVTLGTILFVPIAILWLARGEHYSLSVFVLDWAFCLLLLGGSRFAIRAFREAFVPMKQGRHRVVIVGAGDAGEMLLREMKAHQHLAYDPIGFVDDDPRKRGMKIHGVKVLAAIDSLGRIVEREAVDEVIVAIPSATATALQRILDICRDLSVRIRRVPTEGDIVRLTQIRDVDLEDLLERAPVRLDEARLREQLKGARVLVTGAGGSIGSEVVRQVSRFEPDEVWLVDWSENALFFLERELLDNYPDLSFRAFVADIRDEARMDALFAEGRFQYVYHAAAFKHVPLMEANPAEAVKNNVFGTKTLAECARRHGVRKFVLISTDKAVRPTSVMGASKRTAEMYLSTLPKKETQYLSVRFGNVLGSQGSVIPLFKRQIAEGGPVTVTDPEVVRYFMTIPEAVQLVLQAGVMGNGGEVFLLDMGEPVKILDLARKLIRLSGFRPDQDIRIRFVGLRPGEKLFEELLVDEAGAQRTTHEKILVLDGDGCPSRLATDFLDDLHRAAEAGDAERTVRELLRLVDDYRPNNPNWASLAAPEREKLVR